MILTQDELNRRLRADDVSGAYLLAGEEAYLRRAFTARFREKILTDPNLNAFNHILHEGASLDLAALRADVETPPFFAPHKLIEWHGADLASPTPELCEQLAALAAACTAETGVTLLLCVTPEGLDAGTARRPSAAFKRLAESLTAVNFERSTDARLLGWLGRHFTHEGTEADAAVCRLLLSRAGRSMDVLANEVEKLAAYVKAHGRAAVTEADVYAVTSVTVEEDAFGLTNALLDRDAPAAFRNLKDMQSRRVEPTFILAQISRLYADLSTVALLLSDGLDVAAVASTLSMNAYRADLYARAARKRRLPELHHALTLCMEADRIAKTAFGTDLYVLLDRLVAELLT